MKGAKEAPDRKAVSQFLREMREKLRVFDVAFRPRDKNTATLLELEMAPWHRNKVLLALTEEDCFSGPNPDLHQPGRPPFFEFGTKLQGREIYIKMSLGIPGKQVDCMSFHFAEYPLRYPLRE